MAPRSPPLPAPRRQFLAAGSMFDLRNLAAWRVTYATRLTAGDRRFLDGILVVRRDTRRLLLLNSSEQVVDSRGIGDQEDIPIGGVVILPRHEARIPVRPLAPESLVGGDSETVLIEDEDEGAGGSVSRDLGEPMGGAVVDDCCGEVRGDPNFVGAETPQDLLGRDLGEADNCVKAGDLGAFAGSWAPALVASQFGSGSGADLLQAVALSLQSACQQGDMVKGVPARVEEKQQG